MVVVMIIGLGALFARSRKAAPTGEEEDMEALNQEDADGQPKKPAKVKPGKREPLLRSQGGDLSPLLLTPAPRVPICAGQGGYTSVGRAEEEAVEIDAATEEWAARIALQRQGGA